MRDILKIIKRHFILLLGTGLFTYGLFNFSSGYHSSKGMWELFSEKVYPVSTYYYYNDTSLILLTIGAIFIVIGLLKLKKEREANLKN